MNVIDISGWQSGMDLETMFRENPLDGVIVKATQGTSFINPRFDGWAKWLDANKKRFGLYHFLDQYGAKAEARHFVDVVKPYIGRAIFVCDYEGNTVRKGAGYLKEWLDEVHSLTGVKSLVYVSQSLIRTQAFGLIAEAGYPLWLAQYADSNIVRGFIENPWQNGSVAPFPGYVMQQYTSTGRLNGWKNNLDLDKFFGTAQDWDDLCSTAPVPALKGPDPVVVSEVLSNRYGAGDERAARLREAGYDPGKIQAKINELYAEAAEIKPLISDNMEYLNSIIKIVRAT